jgi:anti-sigma regulatory factor (Ser/Thr protein kinase)
MRDAEADMPGAPLTVAEQRGLRNAARRAPAAAAVSAGATRTFARRTEEVPAARRFVRDALADHPASLDAELLACELVTNAVQHATDAARVTVAVTHRGPVVHVDVIDDGQTGLPHWREADGHDEDGRGFQLVNEIAQRWGFLREPAGTCVWFELAPLGGPRRARRAGKSVRGEVGARGSRRAGKSARGSGCWPGPGR